NPYARVVRMDTTDSTHPTTGWYVEANLTSSFDGSEAAVEATCVDFPAGSTITHGTLDGNGTSVTIASGSGIKGCGLFEIRGALKSSTSGALIMGPDVSDGDWTITVSSGNTAGWRCVK